MRVLVVGGNGFLGSHLVDELAGAGHEVAVFDRFAGRQPQWIKPGVAAIDGDILNAHDVREAVAPGWDAVAHFVWLTTPSTSDSEPSLEVRANVPASLSLFDECVRAGVGRVVFASSGGAIYGDAEGPVHRETDRPDPVSPYAIGKLAVERYLAYYRRRHDLKSVSLRIANPYGPRQNPSARQGVIPIFLRSLAEGRPLTVMGDGDMVRDYLYVADVAKMAAQVIGADPAWPLYNIGAGQGHTINEIVDVMARITGIVPRIETIETPPTFVRSIVLDATRFGQEFGQQALTSLDDGIAATWAEIQAEVGTR